MTRLYMLSCTLIFSVFIFIGCKSDKKEHHSEIIGQVNGIKIIRFEQVLFDINSSNLIPELEKLSKKYPDLYPVFINGILGIRKDPAQFKKYEPEMKEFLTNKYVLGLYDSVQLKYPTLKKIEKEFDGAFDLYLKAFPKNPRPVVYSIISEFGAGTFTVGKETIGIGLDMFLGSNYRYYPSVGIPNFMLHRLDRQYILPNAMQVLAKELTKEPVDKPTLLAYMVWQGKVMYFTEQMLPKVPEDRIIGFQPAQLKWCKESETGIWGFYIEKELLYNTRTLEFSKYLDEAPYTYGMPPESPGRVAVWSGWQIVRSYMKNNPNVTLSQLMADNDLQNIFNKSGYKPRKN